MNLLLDIARGMAALSVFLFHVGDAFAPAWPNLVVALRVGALGVPMFFVLSGYVIAASAESALARGEPATGFLRRRFLRIFPPFWLSILVVVAMPYVVAAVSALKSGTYEMPSPRFLALGAVDWLEVASLTRAFRAVGDDVQAQFSAVNAVYWTLAIEFQFYLCIFAALLVRRRFHAIVAAVTVASLLLLLWPLPLNGALFIHYWPMFAVGIGLHYLIRAGLTADRPLGGRLRVASGVLALALVAGVVALALRGSLMAVLTAAFPSAGIGFALITALILWLAEPFGEALEAARDGGHRALRWLLRPAAFLGVISYSVYLLHGVLAQLPGMVVNQVVPPHNPLRPWLMVLGTLALCALFYRWAEKPFMSRRMRALNAHVLEDAAAPARR